MGGAYSIVYASIRAMHDFNSSSQTGRWHFMQKKLNWPAMPIALYHWFNVILMFKVSHELSENVISIFQVSQTHIHTHTLTYTYILTYPNPGWAQMAQMHSSILEHDGRETGTLQIWLFHDGRETGTLQIWLCHDGRETGTLQIWLFHDGCRWDLQTL